jgi:hemerythrin-like domain-containing protein
MTDTLKSVLPQLLKEHQTIMAELENLAEAAKKEKRPEYTRFAEKMMLHARTEEEVLYPASILIGEYLKQKLNPSSKLW